MDVISILSSDGYVIMNKALARKLKSDGINGLDGAILIGELCAEYRYYCITKECKDGYFYTTQDNLEQNTTIGSTQQKRVMDGLEELGLISTKRIGVPAKKYYRINEKQLADYLEAATEEEAVRYQNRSNEASDAVSPDDDSRITKTMNPESPIGDTRITKTDKLESPIGEDKIINKNNKKNNNLKNNIEKKKIKKKSAEADRVYSTNAELNNAILEFIAERAERKKPMTDRAVDMMLKTLSGMSSDEERIQSINNSIMNGWQGVFPVKGDNCGTRKNTNTRRTIEPTERHGEYL